MKYHELDEKGKEEARDWLWSLTFTDSSYWEHVYATAVEAAEMLGITLDDRPYKTVGGATLYEPSIYFSGFSSQGDGACFEGSYRYKAGAAKAIRKECPTDTELHRIADGLQDVQRRNFYALRATTKQSGHYYHSGCMAVEVWDDRDGNCYRDIGDAENDLTQLLRDFADWIYEQLEAEYDHQTRDETLEETILANDYDFTPREVVEGVIL